MSEQSSRSGGAISDPPQDELSVLAMRAQDGDRVAYASLLRKIEPFIRKVLSGSLAQPDWVEDLSQEILISIHKALHTYDPSRPFKPWMTSIIHFRRIDFLRSYYNKRDNVTVSYDAQIFEDSFVTTSDHAGEYKDIEAALDSLPQKQKDVFIKLKIEGYSVQEVADEMDMNASAVKVSAHRTLKKLKEILQ